MIAIVRETISTNTNNNSDSTSKCVCLASLNSSPEHVCRLQCGCEIHASCLNDYIKSRLHDKVIYTIITIIIIVIVNIINIRLE